MLAGNVPGVEVCTGSVCDIMYPTEDVVGLGIFAGALPPPFGDSSVVAEALEVAIRAVQCDEGASEEFEADCLCPSDIAAFRLPVSGEPPCTPMSHENFQAR
jgi:hypothetical protein